jgi:hypothetical protein
MSLFGQAMRPPTIASDEAVRRYVEAIRAEIEPDPLFRRRLRGLVLNQFVAAREGIIRPARRQRRAMGRLGRAVLYASVTLAMSVSVAMAASQTALPGEPLYGLKLEIEALRMQVLPAEFHDDLAVYALAERVSELGRLAEAGEWERALALAEPIHEEYEALASLGIAPAATDGLLNARLDVLDALLQRLPAQAQSAIEHAMQGAPGLLKTERQAPATGHGKDGSAPGQAGTDGRASGHDGAVLDPEPTAEPKKSDQAGEPSRTPSATPGGPDGPTNEDDDAQS